MQKILALAKLQKKWLILAVVVLLIAGVTGGVFAYQHEKGEKNKNQYNLANMTAQINQAASDGVISVADQNNLLQTMQIMHDNHIRLQDERMQQQMQQLLQQGKITQDQVDTTLATMALVHGNMQQPGDKKIRFKQQLEQLVNNGTITSDQQNVTLATMKAIRENCSQDGKQGNKQQMWQNNMQQLVSDGLINQAQASQAISTMQTLKDKGYLGKHKKDKQ